MMKLLVTDRVMDHRRRQDSSSNLEEEEDNPHHKQTTPSSRGDTKGDYKHTFHKAEFRYLRYLKCVCLV